MNIIQVYNKIKDNSVFNIIPEGFHDLILDNAQIKDFKALESINIAKEVNILIEGQINEDKKNYHTIQGRVIGGILSSERTHVQAKTEVKALSFDHSILEQIFSAKPQIKRYIQNLSQYASLFRFKKDLSLLDLKKDKIIELLSNTSKAKEINFSKENIQVFIVKSGEVRSYFEDKFIHNFQVANYFIPKEEIKFEASNDAEFLVIDIKENLIKKETLKLLDILYNKINQFQDEKKRQEELEDLELEHDIEDDDDDFEVKDFKLEEKELKKLHSKKFIWFQQHDQMDCGAACLAMISRFYGKKINLATWRSLVHITKEGASMLSLKKAAERVGFDSIGVMSGYKALRSLQVPMIGLMEYHFVVIYQVNENDIWIADPGSQLHKISKEDFTKEFSNNALLLKPNNKLKDFPNSKNSFFKYLELFKGSKIQIFEILVISLIIFCLGLTTPLFLQFVFDNVLVSMDEKYLRFIAILFMGIVFLKSISNKIRGNLIASLTSKLTTKFTSLFISHVFKLPLSYFAVRNVGDITTRLGELEKIRNFFSSKLVVTFINLISLFLYSGVLYLYNPKLLLVFLPFIPVFLVVLRVIMKKVIVNLNNTFKAAGKNQSLTFEQVNSIETLKNLGSLLAARWRWEETLVNLLTLKKRFENLSMFLSAFATIFKETVQLTLFMTAIYLYFEDKLSLGQVIAVQTLAGSIVAPLIALMQEWDEFTKIGVSIEKVDEIFTSKIEKLDFSNKSKKNTEKLAGDIKFTNVSFQYGNEHSPMVLKSVNLSIPEGKTIAFVGSSGSGKTTLAYMLNRLYEPTKGFIEIGDNKLNEISLESLREHVAMINQDNSIFAGSFLENITMGDDTPDFNRAVESAKLAAAHDFIMEKNGGYYYQLGESGSGISGGQKQRLNIARALYRNPNILILDEATSALDSKSENLVMESIKSRKGKTTFIIAHRLNTIMHADLIYVFHNGIVVEQGTHRELILKKSHYYFMFKKQING